MSCRDIGSSTAPPLGTRSAISKRKPATRSSALLIRTSECSCTRRSSQAVSSHVWRATSLSLAPSAITVLRLITMILQSVIASAENVAGQMAGYKGKQASETARSQDETNVLLRPFLLGQINGHIRTETSQYSGIEKIDSVKAVQARTRWRGFSSIGQRQTADGWRAQDDY